MVLTIVNFAPIFGCAGIFEVIVQTNSVNDFEKPINFYIC
jgi:hypothetical protein